MSCVIFISMEPFDTTADARWTEICDHCERLVASSQSLRENHKQTAVYKLDKDLIFRIKSGVKEVIERGRCSDIKKAPIKHEKTLVCLWLGRKDGVWKQGGGRKSAVAFPCDCDTARVRLSIFSQGSSVTTGPPVCASFTPCPATQVHVQTPSCQTTQQNNVHRVSECQQTLYLTGHEEV